MGVVVSRLDASKQESWQGKKENLQRVQCAGEGAYILPEMLRLLQPVCLGQSFGPDFTVCLGLCPEYQVHRGRRGRQPLLQEEVVAPSSGKAVLQELSFN